MARLVAPTQGSFHSRVTWDRRLESPAHESASTMCASVCPQHSRARCLWTTKFLEWASTSWSALQCSQAPITAELVPFSSVLEVMWSALQGQQYYTHISAQFLEVLTALHSTGEIHKVTSAHWKRYNSSTPLPHHNMFWTHWIFCETGLLTFSQRKQGSRKCLQALSTHVLHVVLHGLKAFI